MEVWNQKCMRDLWQLYNLIGVDGPYFPCMLCNSPNSVVTLGVLTVIVKAGVARSRWRTGCPQISSLFSWFRACMFVSSVNFRSFRVSATGVNGFCL